MRKKKMMMIMMTTMIMITIRIMKMMMMMIIVMQKANMLSYLPLSTHHLSLLLSGDLHLQINTIGCKYIPIVFQVVYN